MKRFALLMALFGFFVCTGRIFAAPSTPSATPAGNAKQVEDLKDRLATKVAELRKAEKKAMFGPVKSISTSMMWPFRPITCAD